MQSPCGHEHSKTLFKVGGSCNITAPLKKKKIIRTELERLW